MVPKVTCLDEGRYNAIQDTVVIRATQSGCCPLCVSIRCDYTPLCGVKC